MSSARLELRLPGVHGRPVDVTGVGLLCPAGVGPKGASGGRPGEVPGFRARAYIQERKSIKLMTRAVQLGVSAVRLALIQDPSWETVPPERRAMYVGASPQPGDPEDLRRALDAARDADGAFSLGRFAVDGIPLIHPLWLVRGLSNNVLGFSSANHNLQGANANYCDGPEGGWTALIEGARAVSEGRADLALAGGADALVAAESLLGGRRCGEGAAFLLLRPGTGESPVLAVDQGPAGGEEELLGFLGAATWPVSIGRQLLRRASALGGVG